MPDGPHRRDFVRTLALGATAGWLARPASGQEPKPKPKDPADQRREAEVEARMALLIARYGDGLDEEARKTIRRDVEATVRRGERLRKFTLENGDGPAPIFVPYRKPLA